MIRVVPSFYNHNPHTVNITIEAVSAHALVHHGHVGIHPAISSVGFLANRDATYVVVADIEQIADADAAINLGLTSTARYNSGVAGRPGYGPNGICLFLKTGKLFGGNGLDDINWSQNYLDANITNKAKEVITIFTISNNGAKKEIQFIVDGNEGPVHECDKKHFENGGDVIFPVATLEKVDQKLKFIPFDQVKSRSPKIDELMKEFKKPLLCAAPSTLTAENDTLIFQLRDRVSQVQDALIQEKDKQVKMMKESCEKQLLDKDRLHHEQLTAKDRECRLQLNLKDQQLALERAEHQKTRNYLHQIKLENKDMEICFLK